MRGCRVCDDSDMFDVRQFRFFPVTLREGRDMATHWRQHDDVRVDFAHDSGGDAKNNTESSLSDSTHCS
eukprot:1854681-Rhodomonas_salina.1